MKKIHHRTSLFARQWLTRLTLLIVLTALGLALSAIKNDAAAEKRCSAAPKIQLKHTHRPIDWDKHANLKAPTVGLYIGGYDGRFWANCARVVIEVIQYHAIKIKKGEEGNACVRGHELRHKKIADGFPVELKKRLRRGLKPGMPLSRIDNAMSKAYIDAKNAIRKKQEKFDAVYGHMDTNNCRYAPRRIMKPKVYRSGS